MKNILYTILLFFILSMWIFKWIIEQLNDFVQYNYSEIFAYIVWKLTIETCYNKKFIPILRCIVQ